MEVAERPDGVTVVNDAYNANPDSMRAALEALVAMARRRRRTWAVLGEMRELGAASDAEHDEVGRLAARLGVDRLVVVGRGRARHPCTGAVAEGALDGEESVLVPDARGRARAAARRAAAGDVVLVKASRERSGLETRRRGLLARPGARPHEADPARGGRRR